MDTLSNSVSTLKLPALHSKPRQFYHFKTPSASQQLPPTHFTTKPNSISNRNTNIQILSLKSLTNSPSFLKPPPNTHQNPATGYAAALLDIAQFNNSLETVEKDVKRLSKLLRNEQIQCILINPLVGDKEKGLVLKEVGKKGKFNSILVRLLTMLIERNKIMIVNEVLVEFQRIFDELSGTKVVLVSSKKKMEEDALFRIAQSVQKFSGAVKVKVRNLVDEKLPSSAV
ncbi:ATP synthase delta chain, chloroplastic [Ricinus communis]|uniref:ATP synthase delta chain, putative n=1 Tax=Ricinus communis TaxID=3988 RepID=B9SBC4_RICCO|nr:ATP synthase delta chain, chloroplastic [Ricinus communis]EEF39009.1 ATP synthase delta chain, putative [Ricinus communis]|eukprot:XP_002523293.1 ATP synthase delta chain, chloroplastic [Ricinus communis]